jgi:hypothetical protein
MAEVNLFAQVGSSLCRPDVEECVFHVVTDILDPQLIAALFIDLVCKVVMRVKMLCLKLLHLPNEAVCHKVALILCGHI